MLISEACTLSYYFQVVEEECEKRIEKTKKQEKKAKKKRKVGRMRRKKKEERKSPLSLGKLCILYLVSTVKLGVGFMGSH